MFCLYSAYIFNRVTEHFGCQIDEISEIVLRSHRSVPASVIQVEGRSTVEDRRLRNSYHRVCYVFAARAASACHWSWTAVGDDQRLTEGDSCLRGTREPLQRATDVRAPRH